MALIKSRKSQDNNNDRRLYPIKNIITRDVIPVKLSHNYNVVIYKDLYPIHNNKEFYSVNGGTYLDYLTNYYDYLVKQTGQLVKGQKSLSHVNQKAVPELSPGSNTEVAKNPYSKSIISKLSFPIFSSGLVVGFSLPDAQINVEQMSIANVKYPVLNSVVDTPTFSMEVVEDAESNVLTNILYLMASQFHMAYQSVNTDGTSNKNRTNGRGVSFPPFVIDGLTIEVLIYSDYPNINNLKLESGDPKTRDNIKFLPQYKIVFSDCILTSYTNTGYQAAGDRLQYTLNFAHKHIDIQNVN